MKTVKYGKLSVNATHWAKAGKEAWIAYAIKRYQGRPIFDNRNAAQQKEWAEQMWTAIEAEAGVKPKATPPQGAGKGDK